MGGLPGGRIPKSLLEVFQRKSRRSCSEQERNWQQVGTGICSGLFTSVHSAFPIPEEKPFMLLWKALAGGTTKEQSRHLSWSFFPSIWIQEGKLHDVHLSQSWSLCLCHFSFPSPIPLLFKYLFLYFLEGREKWCLLTTSFSGSDSVCILALVPIGILGIIVTDHKK